MREERTDQGPYSSRWRCARNRSIALSLIGVIALARYAASSEGHAPPAPSRFIRKGAASSEAIVFVHGVFGDATSTWTNKATGAYWPTLLTQDPTFAAADIFVYQYPSPALGQSLSIDEVAENLRLVLSSEGLLKYSRLIFVTHSMGGLVARSFLLKYQKVAPHVLFLSLFATPTTGSGVSAIASVLSRNPQLGQMLTMSSASYLADQERSWQAAELTIPCYCAYEVRDTFGVKVVEQRSATHLCNRPLDPIDANHIDIVKPASRDDVAYRVLKSAYMETHPTAAAPGVPPVRRPPARPFTVVAYANGKWVNSRVVRQPFEKLSEQVNVGCEETRTIQVQYTLPPGSTAIEATAEWINTDNILAHGASADVAGLVVTASGSLAGLNKQLLNCPGGGHGTLRLRGTCDSRIDSATEARIELGESELSGQPVTFAFPQDEAYQVESAELVVGAPDAANKVSIKVEGSRKSTGRITREAFGTRFTVTLAEGVLSIVSSPAN